MEQITKEKRMLRVAAYIRVSSEHEQQEDSYEVQERYFSSLLTQNPDWISAGIYSDYGISGTEHLHRRGFNRLMRHCEEGRIDRIVCKSISRFARNTTDFLTAIRVFQEHSVRILFEKENLDTENATSEFILTTLGAIAQEESRSISENQKWAIKKRLPKGEVPNKALYGYRFAEGKDAYEMLETGYCMRRLEIVEEEAAIVRRIFQAYIDGNSANAIAGALNRDGIAPPKQTVVRQRNQEKARRVVKEANGKEAAAYQEAGWTGKRVLYILSQVRYAGNVLAQKTYVESYITHRNVRNWGELPKYYICEHHPAIISEEMYWEAWRVSRLNANGTKLGRRLLPFSKILLCAHCGRSYHVRKSAARTSWFCPNAAGRDKPHFCRAERVSERQLLRMLRKAFIERFDLFAGPVQDDAMTANILSGQCGNMAEPMFAEESRGFLVRMITKLEWFQQADYMEKERAFYKRRIGLLQMEKERAERILKQTAVALSGQRNQALIDAERSAAQAGERLKEELAQLKKQEQYWDESEANYEYRKHALAWLKGLAQSQQGVIEFLNGMTTEYVKAFVLDIVIYDSRRFRVRWYDNTMTDVELFGNADF